MKNSFNKIFVFVQLLAVTVIFAGCTCNPEFEAVDELDDINSVDQITPAKHRQPPEPSYQDDQHDEMVDDTFEEPWEDDPQGPARAKPGLLRAPKRRGLVPRPVPVIEIEPEEDVWDEEIEQPEEDIDDDEDEDLNDEEENDNEDSEDPEEQEQQEEPEDDSDNEDSEDELEEDG